MKLDVTNPMRAWPGSLAKWVMGVTLGLIITLLGGIVACNQSDDALDIDNENNVAAKIRADREKNCRSHPRGGNHHSPSPTQRIF